jgi:diadenosine tetraphosphate (Ap4A) HIT family hydrolase
MDGCIACDLAEGRQPLPGGLIFRRGGWLVEHCVGPLGAGTLILKPARHVLAVADLTTSEADDLGPLLRHTSWVARQLVEAEQVYICLWSHAGGLPVHIHFVVQPVTRRQMAQYGSHGPNLQVAMFAAGQPPDAQQVEQMANTARRLFAEFGDADHRAC